MAKARNIIELCDIFMMLMPQYLKRLHLRYLNWIMRKFNSLGRSYIPGKPLSGENRELIVNEIVRLGGDYITGDFEGNFSDVDACLEYQVRPLKIYG